MSPEIFEKWQHIVNDVDKTKIPVEFITKIILKLQGRRQRTINIQQMLNNGFDSDEIETAIQRKLEEYDEIMTGIEFVLDIEGIAEVVQPETDNLLKNL